MTWFIGIAFVLTIVYAAALLLVAYDRAFPRPSREPSPPTITRHPNFRTLRWFLLPILVPIWIFALAVWFIVYLPVMLWRCTASIANQLFSLQQTPWRPDRTGRHT